MSDVYRGGPYAVRSRTHQSQYEPARPQAARHGGQPEHYGAEPAYYGGQPEPYGAAPPYGQPQPQAPGYPPTQPAQPVLSAGAVGRILHGTGALLSVALIAGLAVWGYKLAVRDVSGVPVVRALAGPMRIQPEDPGGVAAAHQGLAVNSVAADSQAEGPTSQVTLAPAPMALAAGDMPARSGAEISAVTTAEADEVLPEVELTPQTVSLADDSTGEVANGMALANAISAGAEPLTGDEADLSLTPEAAAVQASVTVPATVPGVARSPRPQPRPDEVVARAAASPVDIAVASASAAALPSVREVDASQISAGTRLVQLGAFDSTEVARSEWAKLSTRFPEMLEGKDRVIQQAQSGGKTFYRLRAMGFEDLSDARRFCATLMAGQAACIPVVTR